MKRLCVHVVSISCAMAFAGAAFAVDNYHDACSPMPDDIGIATRPI